MKIVKSDCIWHTTAMIVMKSGIIGLLEMASQMVISIGVSHDPIAQYYVTFYEKGSSNFIWQTTAAIVVQSLITGLLEVGSHMVISIGVSLGWMT